MKIQDRNNRSRRSIRLKAYNYSRSGYYFVTICAQDRQCVLGDITNGKMALNDAGRMVETNWNRLPQRFPNIELDEFIIMPNHIHGIIVIVGATLVVAQNKAVAQNNDRATTRDNNRANDRANDRATTRVAPTVGDIIGAFKSITTNEYIRNVKSRDWPPFKEYLWQRNYYEHIIRDESDLNRIREYIMNNQYKWQEDEYYTE